MSYLRKFRNFEIQNFKIFSISVSLQRDIFLMPINYKLLSNFLSLGIVQLISSLLQLVVIPYVILTIGVDGFGIVAVAQVVMFYLSSFTEYGFNQTATRQIALHKADHYKLEQIFSRVFFSRLILCGIAFIVLLLLIACIPLFRTHSFLYLTAFVFVAGQSLLLTWFFQGLEKMGFIAMATLLARVIFAILVFSFIKGKTDGYLFLLFLGTGNLIAAIASIAVVLKIYRFRMVMPSRDSIINELRDGWQIMVTNLSIGTCQYANIFILRFFTNDLVVGYYSVAERLFFTIRQLLGVFSQTIYPSVCQLVQKGRTGLLLFFRNVYIPFFFFVTTCCFLVFIFAPQVLAFFMGHEHDRSVPLLRVFLVISVIVCLQIPAATSLLAMDQKKSYFKVYTIATALNIAINCILVYFLDARGTVLSILITEVFVISALLWQLTRNRKPMEVLLKFKSQK
jgi:polysaccharide transporter, PST family